MCVNVSLTKDREAQSGIEVLVWGDTNAEADENREI